MAERTGLETVLNVWLSLVESLFYRVLEMAVRHSPA